jgi:hypothetical protein
MTDFLASIAKNGLRESLRMWWRRENTLFKKPPKTHSQYALIRRRTRNGRKMRPAVYRLTMMFQGDPGKIKTYERVSDGAPLDEDDLVECVTVKKTVLHDKRQRERTTCKEKAGKRAFERDQWVAVGVHHLPTLPSLIVHVIVLVGN